MPFGPVQTFWLTAHSLLLILLHLFGQYKLHLYYYTFIISISRMTSHNSLLLQPWLYPSSFPQCFLVFPLLCVHSASLSVYVSVCVCVCVCVCLCVSGSASPTHLPAIGPSPSPVCSPTSHLATDYIYQSLSLCSLSVCLLWGFFLCLCCVHVFPILLVSHFISINTLSSASILPLCCLRLGPVLLFPEPQQLHSFAHPQPMQRPDQPE